MVKSYKRWEKNIFQNRTIKQWSKDTTSQGRPPWGNHFFPMGESVEPWRALLSSSILPKRKVRPRLTKREL